ncbi:ATP-dependent helicase HrpB [Oceanibium sediminis]|uniref:ATP-dependent helicase HrpB n=1 Tax=Oceanibium sediminis TaxID=2026339 RepID=UPI000DD4B7A1|nr:ATP-dependent helicase HrpB [Oceanibium sediminis]
MGGRPEGTYQDSTVIPAAKGLPIAPVLGQVCAAVRESRLCVLQAPPGAGKTTTVPLALLAAGGIEGRILMLEPRRVAARAAAERLAQLSGQEVGGDVGYRMRGDSRPGARIEVITEGILTRMIQSDPSLEGIGCVIFDEFHERALQADLGLALVQEIRGALRDDLALVVMSATLDAGPVAALLGAPIVTSEGQGFPVETRWLDTPLGPGTMTGRAFEAAAADLIARAAAEEPEGDILAFLPGQREIGAVAARLSPKAEVLPLHGGLPFAAQRAALAPAQGRRKVVLATAIAETSLTLPGVRVVVDAGRARRARLDPATGMSRLVTERVTRAEATQRQGRAGRVGPGVCYRLWTKGEEGALAAFPPAEIEVADLVPLALDLALWGAPDPTALPFLTQPAPGAYAAARSLLQDLGALDASGRLSDLGRAMGKVPAHPRLAAMLLAAGPSAAPIAALLEARDPLANAPSDLGLRLAALRDPKRFAAEHPYRLERGRLSDIAREAKRLARAAGPEAALSPGAAAALAYPDRIALRRAGDAPRYLLSGGSGAHLADNDPLATQRLLVALDLDGVRSEARIRRTVTVSEAELRDLFAGRIETRRLCRWSRRTRTVEAREEEAFGALVLRSVTWSGAGDAERIPAFLEGVRDLGLAALNWSKPATALRGRIGWAAKLGAEMPDVSDAALLAGLEDWLAPWLSGMSSFSDVRALDLHGPLEAMLGLAARTLGDTVPARFTAPTGSSLRIDYSGEQPAVEVRLQELFGLDRHPVVGPDRVPLQITLLSPGGKPVQTTSDLPGFWRSSYADVRKDMRGRYPRHPWPEDPASAPPTRRAKPRGT